MDLSARVITLALAASGLAIVYGLILVWKINKLPTGSDKMKEIAAAIQEGAKAFLNRQYRSIAIIGALVFVVLWVALGRNTAWGFAIGAVYSALAGYIGMNISV